MKLSDTERDGLSEEEIKAIEADLSEDEVAGQAGTAAGVVEDPAEAKEAKAEAKPADAKTDAKADDKPVEAKADAKPDAKAEADKAAEAAKSTEAAVVDEPAEKAPFAVPFHHQARVKPEEAKAKLDALQKDFEDGKLEMPEFLAKRDEITTVVIADRVASGISEKSKDQTAAALWERAVDDFLDDHPVYKKDDVLYDALDQRVKRLAADEKNKDLSDKQLLAKADAEITSRFKTGDTPKVADPKAALAASRKPDLTDVPRTLGTVPAAADNTTADDEFAGLDKLDSIALEQALARMPLDKAERYLKAAA
jgi:hypothetical protein